MTSAENRASAPEVAVVAAFSAGDSDAGRRGMGASRAAVKAREVDHTFNPDQSAGLFTGVSTFFDAYGQPSTEIHAIDFAADDAVDLAALFSLELELIRPANVRLALSGTPKKPSSAEALARLLALGAKRYEARFITVLDLLDDVSRLTRADGILITSFATHGYSSGGRDHLLCQDSLLAQPQVSSLCVQDLLGRMQEPDSTSSKRRLLLIDACREFLKKSRGMKTEGLSDSFGKALEAARGTVVLTGTVAGGFSYDDAESQNGVFTSGVRQGLLGAAGSDERGFITPETLAVYLDERVVDWVAQNRKGDREQSTGISKIIDGACAQMPLAVNQEKWAEWRRREDLKSKPTAAQIQAALARLDGELTERAPVLRSELCALRERVTREGGDEAALARIDVIALETLKISFAHFALRQKPKRFETGDTFPGARAFLETEAHFFFGREQLVEQLVRSLDESPVVTLIGRAGCGMTSLVRAGLFPALRSASPDLQYIELALPGEGPIVPALEAALLQRDPARPLLLFLEHFSEATLHAEDAPAFVERFTALASAAPRVRVVLSRREGSLGWDHLTSDLWAALPLELPIATQVSALEGRDLQSAIEQQVARGNAVLSPPALAARIVREVQHQRCRMALVQRTLDELHHRRHADLLSESEYDAMGGIDGALAGAAESFYLACDDAQRGVVETLFTSLLRLHPVDPNRDAVVTTDSRWFLTPDLVAPEAIATVRRLDDERLVLIEDGEIHLTHERLRDTWKRFLDWRMVPASRSFLLQRQEISDAAKTWLEKKTVAHRGDQVTPWEALRTDPRLLPPELAYLRRCFELRDLERRNILDERLKDLTQTGWGVIFPEAAPGSEAAQEQEDIRAALAPLCDLRRRMVKNSTYYREIAGADGYRPGETKAAFLARHGASPGSVDPAKLPYYLLLVGDPAVIPFEFQCQLDIQHAVGRIHFDTLDDYARYALSVKGIEELAAAIDRPKFETRCAFFAPCHADDPATASTSAVLRAIAERRKEEKTGYPTGLDEVGSKADLLEYFRALNDPMPGLLVAAGHGIALPDGDRRQPALQGALLCPEWPGPGAPPTKLLRKLAFTAADVGEQTDLSGRVVLFWSSFSAGTSTMEDDRLITGEAPRQIAPRPRVSALAQRLLGGKGLGGASAFIGMVQRAACFSLPACDQVLSSFQKVLENAVTRLLNGYPVGAALDFFNQYYVELAADLHVLREVDDPSPEHARHVAEIAAAARDARSFVVIGDPAARIPWMV